MRLRVVVLEFNNRFGPDRSVTVPYADNFRGRGASVEAEGYFGASLAALCKLGLEQGYRPIGANAPNTNTYLMRGDVGVADFPEAPVAKCLGFGYAAFQRSTKDPAALGELVEI